MKRISAIIAVILVIVAMSMPMAFASGLEITGTTPKDGATGRQPANMAVKVKFSEDMSSEANDAANKGKIKITDPDGKVYDFTIAHSSKYPNELWLVINNTLESDKEYKVAIEPGIMATSGATTAAGLDLSFKTRDVSKDSTLTTVMMFAMIGLMIFMTSRETKKTMAKEDVNYALAEAKKLNPYKIAKQKKISLEEAKAYCEKERAKAQKAVDKANAERAKAEAERQAELEAAQARIEAELAAAHAASVYHVKKPASVKAAGGAIPKSVKNRAQAKEEAAKQAAKQREQNSKGKKKSKK